MAGESEKSLGRAIPKYGPARCRIALSGKSRRLVSTFNLPTDVEGFLTTAEVSIFAAIEPAGWKCWSLCDVCGEITVPGGGGAVVWRPIGLVREVIF